MRKISVFLAFLFVFGVVFSEAVQMDVYADSDQVQNPPITKNQFLIESARISDLGMEAAKNALARAFYENVTEADVVRAIENAMTDNGSSEYIEAFGVIVASGEQSAIPHGDTSDDETNLILEGEVVVVDLGARYRGYCTDITRTFFMGNATGEMQYIYNILLEAQTAAFEAVRTGAWARDVDKAARDIISSYGYGDNFTHALGHGIGLYIHMPPTLSPSSNEILFESGEMAITIEPGIYQEGRFGIRIEDDVFVLRMGHELLTYYPKAFVEAIILPEYELNESIDYDNSTDVNNQGMNYLLVLGALILVGMVGIVAVQVRKRRSP